MPKYYEISEAAAKRAKDMNSYSDYAPGSATAGYRTMVDEAYALAEKQKAQVDPMYHDKIDALVDRYARRLAENLNERNAIDARVPSILITGGGNSPWRKRPSRTPPGIATTASTPKLKSCWTRSAPQAGVVSAPTMTSPWKSSRKSWRGWSLSRP